ncbi:MAG TPA: hypothetical protein VJM49_19585 [Acidimicrobiales bacterium]|nr:hypothetical protein [Acidimicrobiales bacterium]
MAYATPEQLATGLNIRVTAENSELLTDCLDAATVEIDHFLAGRVPVAEELAMVGRTNVNRAVEWYKATDTYNGGVGYDQTGVLTAPASGFERHAAAMLPLQTSWGLA